MSARPWPISLLSALGAWLVAIPVFGVAALLLEPILTNENSVFVVGLLILAGGIALLRTAQRSLFVENLGLPIFIVGLALMAWGLHAYLSVQPLLIATSLLTLMLTALIPQPWIRTLLGAMSAALLLHGLNTLAWWHEDGLWLSPWLALHLLVALWIGFVTLTRHGAGTSPLKAVLADVTQGWGVATLLALTWWSGSTFLLSQSLPDLGIDPSLGTQPEWGWANIHLGSSAAALLAALAIAWRWPQWRQAWCAGLAVIVCGLSAFMPLLGGVLLMASVSLVTHRQRMAILAALVALWVIGAFYYQLAWPLTHKAAVLIVAGALLGGLAAWGRSTTRVQGNQAQPTQAHQRGTHLQHPWGMALSLLAVLLVANASIWKNETIIRDGRVVYVALAPVDPRSLMQGDYMTLRFDIGDVEPTPTPDNAAVQLVFKIDPRGIATALRQHQGEPIQTDELIMRLHRQKGEWQLVTDAFYFKEGEAERWANARFGELRVDAKGRALLVGLRGENLTPL